MAIGIKLTGNSNTIENCLVVSDGEGIDVAGDFNIILNTKVYISDAQIVELIKQLKLPNNTPIPLVREAIDDVVKASSVASLEDSKLKAWLAVNGFNLAYWTQIVQSIAQMVFQ